MRNFGENAAILFSKCCTMSQIFSLACQFNKAGIAYFCLYVADEPDGMLWSGQAWKGYRAAIPDGTCRTGAYSRF